MIIRLYDFIRVLSYLFELSDIVRFLLDDEMIKNLAHLFHEVVYVWDQMEFFG
jgi:hypothetical protein